MLSASADNPMTTPMDPGPESMGIAIGVSEMSSLVAGFLAFRGGHATVSGDHAPGSVGDDQAAGNLQHRQRNAEEDQHKASEEEEDDQNCDHVSGGL